MALHTAGEVMGEGPVALTFAPPWPAQTALPADAVLLTTRIKDVSYGGGGRVSGTIKVKGTPNAPVSRRVRLIRDIDAVCVGETWSDPVTGAYEFTLVDRRVTYTALAYDYTEVFRAVAADRLVAEAMP